jgi:dienelactone hydrolase
MNFSRRLSTCLPISCSLPLAWIVTAGSIIGAGATQAADRPDTAKLAAAIERLSPLVLTDSQRDEASGMIERDLRRRRDAANESNRTDWNAIKTRQHWEAFRDVRLEKLRASLGTFPEPPDELRVKVTGTVDGDGFRIENLVYESRPGDWVTANLYVPAKPPESMPGIMIAHAHHRPKRQGEMQDMGMTWARAGCMVLVIDQVGYGERRAHSFNGPNDYPKEDYKYWRQDYYYRYDSGVQLQLAGDSLMGWMAWDWMRGVDLLLARDGIDPKRIIMLGAVAGGGDPCGVTAALDQRIAAAVPFNFGGPQPETRYPLPDDAETSFNYLMGSYWESTRGLRRTAADGFFHWVIVGGIAPRRLIHGHEFAWDGKRDPVWKRFEKIYGDFYGVRDNLAVAHGHGTLRGNNPRGSHCTNIGRVHREMIHPAFRRWFNIDVTPEDEYSARRETEELTCLTDAARRELKPPGFVDVVSNLAHKRVNEARQQGLRLTHREQREHVRSQWSALLGDTEVKSTPRVVSSTNSEPEVNGLRLERVVIEVEPDVVVPMMLISGADNQNRNASPVVVALAQAGKSGFIEHRADELAELVDKGAIVCLPDLRGTGDTKAGSSRGRSSGDGNRSVNLLMFNQTMVGQRLRDLQSVLAFLRTRKDVDPKHISLWGDSFAPVNAADTNFQVPYDVGGRPHQSEPMGGLLAVLGALFDDGIERVYVRGGLSSYFSVLASPHVYIPHDVVVPGVLTAGDIASTVAALASRPVYLDRTVDGLNRRLSIGDVRITYEPASKSYRDANAVDQFVIGNGSTPATWLLMSEAQK